MDGLAGVVLGAGSVALWVYVVLEFLSARMLQAIRELFRRYSKKNLVIIISVWPDLSTNNSQNTANGLLRDFGLNYVSRDHQVVNKQS